MIRFKPLPLALLAILLVGGCGYRQAAPRWPDFGGKPGNGAVAMEREACGSCHVIPGISDAHGQVGPPLTKFAGRTIVAGVLPNTPPNLIRWLRDPQAVVPGNAMPSTGMSEQEARDVAAYLYTLR